jgi:hypothetical protein
MTSYPSPPPPPATELLAKAIPMRLDLTPTSPGAVTLVDDVAGRVAQHQQQRRVNVRRGASDAKLRQAVAAVVGALIAAWGATDPVPVFRRRKTNDFSDEAVGYRMWAGVIDSLMALELLHEQSGVRFVAFDPKSGPHFEGKAARFWPAGALLDLAVQHGVLPATLPADFTATPRTTTPKVHRPVILRPLRVEGWGQEPLDFCAASLTDPEGREIAKDVADHNAMASSIIVEGCPPPRWRRRFNGAWELHGRWYAVGENETYQQLPSHKRAELRVAGEPVVELDVTASHLNILRALAGLPALTADPYSLAGIERKYAKQWVVETFGRGRPVMRWAGEMPVDVSAELVCASMLLAHPYLEDPTAVLPPELVRRLEAPPESLVWHYLAGVEARAMTLAMRHLRQAGILAMPVHDSLIVPISSQALASAALSAGFKTVCGLEPAISVNYPPS